jgi:phosphoribosylaminoimidazole-succinocarboxamide synthase
VSKQEIPAPTYELPDGFVHVYSGKVRDLYETPEGRLLFVASDRISAYDWVLPTPIPDKGRILTAMSLWWFDRLSDIVENHVVSTRVPESVAGRAMVCSKLEMFPVECVARGYLTGSGLVEYRESRSVCGVNLPPGLKDGSQLPKTIFTPATKAALGDHDENVTFDEVIAAIGQDEAQTLRRLTVAVYDRAAAISAERGIILADTKFEFGIRADGRTVLADEVLTPDSSRYWPADQWEPGHAQPSFDKQYVRDWLTSPASGWDRAGGEAPPALPDEVVEKTRAKYVEAYERLTGATFA